MKKTAKEQFASIEKTIKEGGYKVKRIGDIFPWSSDIDSNASFTLDLHEGKEPSKRTAYYNIHCSSVRKANTIKKMILQL